MGALVAGKLQALSRQELRELAAEDGEGEVGLGEVFLLAQVAETGDGLIELLLEIGLFEIVDHLGGDLQQLHQGVALGDLAGDPSLPRLGLGQLDQALVQLGVEARDRGGKRQRGVHVPQRLAHVQVVGQRGTRDLHVAHGAARVGVDALARAAHRIGQLAAVAGGEMAGRGAGRERRGGEGERGGGGGGRRSRGG